jgi:hypothetical protein
MRESRPTLFAPNSAAADDPKAAAAAAAAAARAAARRPYRFWVSDILKLLITHLQLLGLLRGLRINWPEGVDVAAWLSFFDQTSTVSSWVSLDCSLGEDEPGAAVRRSVKRTLGLLLMPSEPGGPWVARGGGCMRWQGPVLETRLGPAWAPLSCACFCSHSRRRGPPMLVPNLILACRLSTPPPQNPLNSTAVVGTLVGMLFWGLYALGVHMLRRRRPELQRLTWRTHYQPRIILTTVLVMFYLYPQVRPLVPHQTCPAAPLHGRVLHSDAPFGTAARPRRR